MRIAMKLFNWILFAAIILTACSPVYAPLPPAISNEATPIIAPQLAAVATSRGDKLEASDPASVKYGTGIPVLVEFFRFT
jgi:hypothetical protein